MKKKIYIIVIAMNFVLASLTLFACKYERSGNNSAVKDVLNSSMNKDNISETANEATYNVKNVVNNPYDEIDVDLTEMPQKLAYATATRMNMVSEQYIGQVVKINGVCSVFHDEKRNLYFYTCEINDETACCTLGIEFELVDDYKFPDDFPKENDEVTVVGIFDTYKEGARTYKTLRKAVLM